MGPTHHILVRSRKLDFSGATRVYCNGMLHISMQAHAQCALYASRVVLP